jgi:hypothetical protein
MARIVRLTCGTSRNSVRSYFIRLLGRAPQLARNPSMQSLCPDSIPLYSASGALLRLDTPVEYVEENEGHFRVVRNRRGHATRAYMREHLPTDRPICQGNAGAIYRESLSSGWLWAMVMPGRA